MECAHILALAGSLMIVIATTGFIFFIPHYDTAIESVEFNIHQSSFNKVIAEEYLSTYHIFLEMNASSEMVNMAKTKAFNNLKLQIRSQNMSYMEEPLKTELENIDNIDDLNDLYVKTSGDQTKYHNNLLYWRNLFYPLFAALNALGLIMVSIAPMITRKRRNNKSYL